MNKDTVVFDLDGTLADITHRLHYVKGKKKDFDAFYKAIPQDSLYEDVYIMLLHLRKQYQILLVSGRPQHTFSDTAAWLDAQGIHAYNKIFLIGKPNKTDVEVKRAWLNWFGKERIFCVFDDRQRVVDMWRSEGIRCFQVQAWEEPTMDDELKRQIEEFFKDGKTLFFSDIAVKLDISLEQTVKLCKELMHEGKIRIAENYHSPMEEA